MMGSMIRRQAAARRRDDTPPHEENVLDVKVRPLELIDSHKVLQMIYDVQYMGVAKGVALDIIQGKLFLAFVAVIALCMYLTEESNLTMVIANIWFFGAIIAGYWFSLTRVCKKQFFTARDTMNADELYQYWTDKDHGHYLWVAENHFGTIVGIAGVANKSGNKAVIERLAVSSEYQRRSVATQLMLKLLDDCVVRKLDDLEVDITYRQFAAQKMFKKFGFRTNKKAFYEFGTRPFFRVEATKYTLSLERID